MGRMVRLIDIDLSDGITVIDSFGTHLPSVHCRSAQLEHISQELNPDTIDDSDIVAADEESDLAELRIAAMLTPTVPPITNKTAATFFKLIFIFVTLSSELICVLAAHVVRLILLRRHHSLISYSLRHNS